MKLEAILFDLDGTLLYTLEDLALSVNAVLHRYGYPEHPLQDYRFLVGEGVEMLVKNSLPEGSRSPELINELMQAVQEEYRCRWQDHTRPYSGVSELLNGLEEKKIPKAILSNKPHEFTVLTVENILPHWQFDAVEGVRANMPRKPDPAGAIAIAHKLGVEPSQFAYLGDTKTDMQTALAAGMFPVGATWGFRPEEELKESGAKKLVNSPEEVLTVIHNGC